MYAKKLWDIVCRQWLAIVIVLIVGAFAIARLQLSFHDSYSGNAHIMLVTQPGSNASDDIITDLPVVATSTIVLERVKDSLGLPVSLMDLKSHVSAKIVNRSNIMEISYRDQVKSRAIAITNSVADNLSKYYAEISADNYTRNVKSLSAALQVESRKISAINKSLANAVSSDPYVVSDRSVDDITQRLDTLESDRAAAQSDVAANAALANTTQPSADLSKVARHEVLQGDARYKALTDSSAKDFAQLATDRAGYTDRFPGLAGESTKVNNEEHAISRESQRALSDPTRFSASESATLADHKRQLAVEDGAKARVAKLDALIATERSRLNDLSGNGLRVATLRSQLQSAQADYGGLSSRRTAALANSAEAFSLGSIQVLDRAIDADTAVGSQRPMITFVLSTVLILAALLAAIGIDALDPRVSRREQIEALYGRPLISDLGSR